MSVKWPFNLWVALGVLVAHGVLLGGLLMTADIPRVEPPKVLQVSLHSRVAAVSEPVPELPITPVSTSEPLRQSAAEVAPPREAPPAVLSKPEIKPPPVPELMPTPVSRLANADPVKTEPSKPQRVEPVLAHVEPAPQVAPAPPSVAATPVTAVAQPATVQPAVVAAPMVEQPRFDAAYLENPPPRYPRLSRRLGEEGSVMLRVRVNSAGLPLVIELERSSGFERLDRAAQETVKQWRFVPARQGEQAVEAWVRVPLVFSLRS